MEEIGQKQNQGKQSQIQKELDPASQTEENLQMNMTDLYYKDDQERKKGSVHQIDQQTQQQGNIKKSYKSNKSNQKQIFSGISFSKFEMLSEPSSQDAQKPQQNPKIIQNVRKGSMNKIPTSSKAITSKKQLQPPTEVLAFNPQQYLQPTSSKHEYSFHHSLSIQALLSHFTKFALQKKMTSNPSPSSPNSATATLKIPLYKSALSLCFPVYEMDVYQLYCYEHVGKICHLSGDDEKYYVWRDQFLNRLWVDGVLRVQSMHDNIRHFVKYSNALYCPYTIINAKNNKKQRTFGQIDQIKQQIQTTIKSLYQNIRNKNSKNKVAQNKKKQQQIEEQLQQLYNHPEFIKIRQTLRQIEEILKRFLQKQLKKQHQQKIKRQKSGNIQEVKVFVTPSIQRMLLTILYHHISLDSFVKHQIIPHETSELVYKKKQTIASSLSPTDILKYLQLPVPASAPMPNPQPPLFPKSLSLLSSLTPSSSPSPTQILQLLVLFKQTLKKQIGEMQANDRVKVRDHVDQKGDFVKYCVYCVVMGHNRDVWACLEIAEFGESGQEYCEGKEIAKMLRRAILFVAHQWQL